jgi:hypothetical protein
MQFTNLQRRIIVLVSIQVKDIPNGGMCDHLVPAVEHIVLRQHVDGNYAVRQNGLGCDCRGRNQEFFLKEDKLDEFLENSTSTEGGMFVYSDTNYNLRILETPTPPKEVGESK